MSVQKLRDQTCPKPVDTAQKTIAFNFYAEVTMWDVWVADLVTGDVFKVLAAVSKKKAIRYRDRYDHALSSVLILPLGLRLNERLRIEPLVDRNLVDGGRRPSARLRR